MRNYDDWDYLMNLKEALPRGDEHWNAKLTTDKVIRMRTLKYRHDLCIACVAKMYGVNYQTAYDAITGRTWTHLPVPEAQKAG